VSSVGPRATPLERLGLGVRGTIGPEGRVMIEP
jgi:hypothetical protein